MSKNVTRLLILSATCVLAAFCLTLLGPKSQAAPVKKPTPEPFWGAQIAAYGNLAGMGGVFIYPGDPLQRWAQFQGLSLTEFTTAEPGPAGACGFPEGYRLGGSPDCFLSFFNSAHPKPGYEHLLFYFVVDADIEDTSLFPVGSPVQWTGGGAVTIYFWNAFDPLSATDPEPYESVTASLKELCIDYPKGYWITRVDDKTWEIMIEQQVFDMAQFYSWVITSVGRNGKTYRTIANYEPLSGKG